MFLKCVSSNSFSLDSIPDKVTRFVQSSLRMEDINNYIGLQIIGIQYRLGWARGIALDSAFTLLKSLSWRLNAPFLLLVESFSFIIQMFFVEGFSSFHPRLLNN